MTTYLYREDVETHTLRTNSARDPHARGGSSSWAYASAGSSITRTLETTSDTPDYAPGFIRHTIVTASDTGSSSGPYYREDGGIALAAGDTLTVSMYIRTSQAGLTYAPQIVLRAQGANTVRNAEGSPVTLEPGQWARLSATITADGDYTGFQLWAREAVAGSPAAGETLDVTMILAGERVHDVYPYFDGDTVDQAGLYTYEWDGAPDASTSRELAPLYRIEPTLVINYAQERPTGVTAHDTVIGGAPVIVRLPSRRTQRGTFEFYMENETQAILMANLCDGRTNVVLVSDDVPEAPFTFCPTDNVRTSWNSPYDSWVVSVPYVKVTY